MAGITSSVKIVPNANNAKALSQFDRKEANLAILRTDARIPPRARSIAILEHDLFLLISPNGKKIKSIAELKKAGLFGGKGAPAKKAGARPAAPIKRGPAKK